MARWWAVAGSGLILTCSVLTGCSALTTGRAVPADNAGPKPVQSSALHEALLDAGTINDIMGASAMTVNDSRTGLFDDRPNFADRNCMVAWTPAEQTVYAHSGWRIAVAQTLLEAPDAAEHFVVQAVVGFDSRPEADDFFSAAEAMWTPCGERTFAAGRGENPWTFGPVSNADSTLWMRQDQDNGSGWSCQRALRVANNVAIDVLACKLYATDEGITIAEAIDARLPSV